MLPALALLLLQSQADARLANDYRVDKEGWVYVHLAGEPKDIGYAYGTLLAPEIDDAQKALRVSLAPTGKDWSFYRETARKMYWPHVPKEYQDELQGQADGLSAKGYRYDVWDVLAFNSYIDLSQYYLPWLSHHASSKESCSAFIATGRDTKDGKIVMGHELWWDFLMGERFNAILDITPAHGNRVIMDALCGFIHSGSDFALNSKGIVLSETTIAGFEGFDPQGVPEFVRMRKAIQYADNLDSFAKLIEDGNNGGYANTWLVGDTKTNEIGKLELGLKNVNFDRKFDGAFVGSNFPSNRRLIAEEVPGGWDPDPKTNGCEQRRVRLEQLLGQDMGALDQLGAEQILADTFDENAGHDQIGQGTICGSWLPQAGGAINAKVVTASSAAQMQFWARMGIPNGATFDAKRHVQSHPNDANQLPYLHDIPKRPWILAPPSH